MANLPPLPLPAARGAGKARFLASLAFCLNALALVGRHYDAVSSETLLASLLLALILACLALLFAGFATRDIWRYGRPGAIGVFGTIALISFSFVPAIGIAIALYVYPPLDEVGTRSDLFNGTIARVEQPRLSPFSLIAPQIDYRRLQGEAYPDITTTLIDLSTVETIALAQAASEDLGWTVLSVQEPATEAAHGQLVLTARSRVLGIADTIVVEASPGLDGTLLDIGSKSGYPVPDLGENARHIRDFLNAFAAASRRSATQ